MNSRTQAPQSGRDRRAGGRDYAPPGETRGSWSQRGQPCAGRRSGNEKEAGEDGVRFPAGRRSGRVRLDRWDAEGAEDGEVFTRSPAAKVSVPDVAV